LASLSLQHGDSVTCTVNGMISVTSTLRHQVGDVHGTQRSKFTNMISIHLHHSVPNIIKICIFVKVMMKKSVAPFHVDTVCNLIYCTPTSESCVCHVCCTSLVRVLHESRASVV